MQSHSWPDLGSYRLSSVFRPDLYRRSLVVIAGNASDVCTRIEADGHVRRAVAVSARPWIPQVGFLALRANYDPWWKLTSASAHHGPDWCGSVRSAEFARRRSLAASRQQRAPQCLPPRSSGESTLYARPFSLVEAVKGDAA